MRTRGAASSVGRRSFIATCWMCPRRVWWRSGQRVMSLGSARRSFFATGSRNRPRGAGCSGSTTRASSCGTRRSTRERRTASRRSRRTRGRSPPSPRGEAPSRGKDSSSTGRRCFSRGGHVGADAEAVVEVRRPRLRRWTHDTHVHYPEFFKCVSRTFLLTHARIRREPRRRRPRGGRADCWRNDSRALRRLRPSPATWVPASAEDDANADVRVVARQVLAPTRKVGRGECRTGAAADDPRRLAPEPPRTFLSLRRAEVPAAPRWRTPSRRRTRARRRRLGARDRNGERRGGTLTVAVTKHRNDADTYEVTHKDIYGRGTVRARIERPSIRPSIQNAGPLSKSASFSASVPLLLPSLLVVLPGQTLCCRTSRIPCDRSGSRSRRPRTRSAGGRPA